MTPSQLNLTILCSQPAQSVPSPPVTPQASVGWLAAVAAKLAARCSGDRGKLAIRFPVETGSAAGTPGGAGGWMIVIETADEIVGGATIGAGRPGTAEAIEAGDGNEIPGTGRRPGGGEKEI